MARHYDALMGHVDYSRWADYMIGLFAYTQTRPTTVLDMACGTGSLSYALRGKGFSVIGVDASPDMLTAAELKRGGFGLPPDDPMFLCQKLWELDLYDTVDAAVCMLDSLNYITRPELLRLALERAYLFLNPGGALVFDVRTPLFYESARGARVGETPACFCVWTPRYKDGLCATRADIFERRRNMWARSRETHRQRCYTVGFLSECLCGAGFEDVEVFQPFERTPPDKDALRVFFRALKPR